MSRSSSALIAAIAAAPDGAARARLLHDGARALLADPAAVSLVAAAAAAADEGDDTDAAAHLLSRALDEARMALENGAPEGAALLEAVAASLSARDAAAAFAPAVRMRLAQSYARAGLAPPSFALLTPETMDATAADLAAFDGAPDIGAALDKVIRDFGDEPLQVHTALGEVFAGLPPEPGAMLAAMTIARPGAIEARLGLYWLLDQRPAFRLAAATALLQRAEAGALPPDVAALLPAIRKWLPQEPARDALDAAIRRLMRDGAARADSPAPTIHRAAASLPDGAGAQSLIAAVQAGGRRGVAMAMLKQGHGVKDAFVIPCASATEQKRILARVLGEIETIDIAPGALAEALARGLGEGIALGAPPAPGLVDMIAFWGADALVPAPSDAGAILAAIGAAEALDRLSPAKRAGLIEASGEWVERFEQSDAWFEDTGPLRAAIARARTERGCETAVWRHLETRRTWWARQFAVSAATLKAQTKPEPGLWLSFAAVAQALLDQRPLKKLPIMAEIMEMTLEAFYAREGGPAPRPMVGLPPAPHPEAHGELSHLFSQSGMSEPYLQGYLTALAISPSAPPPQAWLGPLLGAIALPDEDALNRLLDLIMMRANRINDDAADATIVAGWIAGLDAAALRDWAAGFSDLVAAAKSAWGSKALAADDKRVLKDITAVAEGGDATALRAVLAVWVARRRALRR